MNAYYVPVVGVWHDPPLNAVLGFQKDSPNKDDTFIFWVDDDLLPILTVGEHEGIEGWWCANTVFIPPFSLYTSRKEAEEALAFVTRTQS